MTCRIPFLILSLAILLLPAIASAQATVVSFQGELTSQGVPYEGPAAFKFAIICDTAGVVWSNDNSSGTGSEPSGAVYVDVVGGVFSVLLGDPALGMVPLPIDNLSLCNVPFLRIWVDTGSGSEQLPDQLLASSAFALHAANAKGAVGSFTVQGTLEIKDFQGQFVFGVDPSSGEVAVNSIRFADGTLQTTAPTGGGGEPTADGHWFFNGPDLYSGASGNVGIGTMTPTQKLHLQSTTGVPVRLALRSGGSWHLLLEQDPESVFSINNGGQKRFAITPGGSVGIGTTTPTRRLDVEGSAVVRGDFTVNSNMNVDGELNVFGGLSINGAPIGSGSFSIPPSAFAPTTPSMGYVRSGTGFYGTTSSQSISVEAPVHLPDGVTVSTFGAVVSDDDIFRAMTVRLIRQPTNGTTAETLVQRTSVDGGRQTLFASSGHVVDNANNFYYVSASWVTPSLGQALVLHGVVLDYRP